MKVDVALFAYLSQYQPDGQGGRHARPLELPDGATIGDLIEVLELPDEPRVVFANGVHGSDDQALCDGDRVAIFPPVAGG
jgi:molybdopterin converting factor small subunit